MIGRFAIASWALVYFIAFGSAAAAQTYPSKPVRIIVPFAAGGITDIVARALAQQLTDRWSQQVVVENKPGGNAQIGADVVIRSAPDGYTLMVSVCDRILMPWSFTRW